MGNLNKKDEIGSYALSGMFTLSLRLIVGWTYFSAFWRRVVLENKLIPDDPGYIGEKFNHFLPNSIGIKPIIEYLVSNPDLLWWAMIIFTIIEGIVGLLFMLGFLTRLMSIGIFLLAVGILSGSGWLGTTCLDEWQIGILGMAAGFTLFFTGGGKYSLDALLSNKVQFFQKNKYIPWITSGALPVNDKILKKVFLSGTVLVFGFSLFTNQVFHGGVWGKLHNKSVKPKIEITESAIKNETLSFTIYRTEGVDVYGSFLIGLTLKAPNGNIVYQKNGDELAEFPPQNIINKYVAKIKPGKHSLVIPLGSKAEIKIRDPKIQNLLKGKYVLILTDISGLTWSKEITVN
ncbi:TQO small subunit DoxD [Coprobacter tertius]|uniref:DoxX family membrane protein n=1 Tax=Coprobacter tertius TaxID=2944915 RepID=A0ABT1MHV0_9BACT|nr:TQO small subunit DoxD [Coprobacter tertius]MCP9612205.1 DoxX family membrane protein [Coprobacter tertius]